MPGWAYTLNLKDIWNNFEEVGFEESRNQIVQRIKDSRFWDEYDFDLLEAVDGLEHSANLSDFNDYWSDFYDWADSMRVWVATF